MDTFNSVLESWQPFFATVATAAATLVGLLFVAFTVNTSALAHTSTQRARARGSFTDLVFVLVLALTYLVPHLVPLSLAVALFVLGLARWLGVVRHIYLQGVNKGPRPLRQGLLDDYILPAVTSLGLLVIAVATAVGLYEANYGLVVVIAGWLVRAARSAWGLLMNEDQPSE